MEFLHCHVIFQKASLISYVWRTHKVLILFLLFDLQQTKVLLEDRNEEVQRERVREGQKGHQNRRKRKHKNKNYMSHTALQSLKIKDKGIPFKQKDTEAQNKVKLHILSQKLPKSKDWTSNTVAFLSNQITLNTTHTMQLQSVWDFLLCPKSMKSIISNWTRENGTTQSISTNWRKKNSP